MGKFNDNYNSLIKSLSEILIEQEFKRESKKRTNYFNREKTELIINKLGHLNTKKVGLIINKIAAYGWYVDDFSYESSLDVNLSLKYIYGNFPEKLDSHFSKYYSYKTDEIEQELILKYPNRKPIISEAFYAHKRGLYHSSICLIITLIDGICDDEYESKFFKNKKNLPEINLDLNNLNKEYLDFLISPIKKKGVINGWEKELHKYPIRLNRHEIIHGKDVDYGTLINSLKMISMLSYINYVLDIFKRD